MGVTKYVARGRVRWRLDMKQTVLLAVSADVSAVRGMSVAEGLVRVGEPRLVVET